MAPEMTLVSYPKIAPPRAATAAVSTTVTRLEADPPADGAFDPVPLDECCSMNSPASNQIAWMNASARSSGASSLPEKRPERYLDTQKAHPLRIKCAS
jgi:hypothetical protein